MPPTTVSISWDLPPLDVPQHPDQRRPHRPILFAVDQQLGECAALPVSPDLLEHSGADDPVPTRDEDQAVQRPDDRRPLQTPVLRTLEEPRRASATGRTVVPLGHGGAAVEVRPRSIRGRRRFNTKFKEALVFPAEVDLTSRGSSPTSRARGRTSHRPTTPSSSCTARQVPRPRTSKGRPGRRCRYRPGRGDPVGRWPKVTEGPVAGGLRPP
jgi:hypothetical protein